MAIIADEYRRALRMPLSHNDSQGDPEYKEDGVTRMTSVKTFPYVNAQATNAAIVAGYAALGNLQIHTCGEPVLVVESVLMDDGE